MGVAGVAPPQSHSILRYEGMKHLLQKHWAVEGVWAMWAVLLA